MSAELVDRLIDAVEGEVHGLAIDAEQAAAILAYVLKDLEPRAASFDIKPLEWIPSHGGKWLRASTPAGTYEVRANDPQVGLAKQRCFERHREVIMSALLPAKTEPDAGRVEGWQPIETAPKDGTEILGFGQSAMWDRKYAPAQHVGWWCNEGECWVGRDPSDYASLHLTYWMPLPTPPSPPREEIEHQGVVAVGVKG